MGKLIGAAIAAVVLLPVSANAADLCAKLKNKNHQIGCRCHVQNGGRAWEDTARKTIQWEIPRAAAAAVDKCLVKHGI